MARDSQGRWMKGSTGNAGGVTHHEIKAARRLKQRLAGMAHEAGLVIERAIQGEEVTREQVDMAKFVVNQVAGKPGSSQTVSGHIDHSHQYSVADNYVSALKELAVLARAERASQLEANGQATSHARARRRYEQNTRKRTSLTRPGPR